MLAPTRSWRTTLTSSLIHGNEQAVISHRILRIPVVVRNLFALVLAHPSNATSLNDRNPQRSPAVKKRFLTPILLSILVLASTPSTQTTKASPPDGREPAAVQARAEVERAIREASKSAVYDQAGRVSKLTLAMPDNKKVGFSFVYDEQGRL